MSTGSGIVLVVILALASLAAWRCIKKGPPCECGCSHKSCKDGKSCSCCG